jgi:hypothetical protein
MGDDDGGAVFHDSLESVIDESLRGLVESAGGLVEQKDAGLADDSSCDSDTLFLTT